MKFKVNNSEWEIKEVDTQTLVDKYNSENDEKVNFVFGVTLYPKHEIWINQDMCEEQKVKTLKHELTHCYIWMYGLYNVPNFNEEMACDLVASSNDFINEVVDQYMQKETITLYADDGVVEEITEKLKNNNR